MPSNVDKMMAARLGGDVERFHVFATVKPVSVAKHCYNAVSILMILHPNPSLPLIKALLWHDVNERWLGDAPAPAKWRFPDLQRAYHAAEEAVDKKWDMHFQLTTEEARWLKAVDMLELLITSRDEQAMGNQYAEIVEARVDKWLSRHWDELPYPVQVFLNEFSERTMVGLVRSVDREVYDADLG